MIQLKCGLQRNIIILEIKECFDKLKFLSIKFVLMETWSVKEICNVWLILAHKIINK